MLPIVIIGASIVAYSRPLRGGQPSCTLKHCPLHAIRLPRAQSIALAREITSESLVEYLRKQERINHFELTRELELLHRPEARDVSSLVLAIYARTHRGVSASTLIESRQLQPEDIEEPKVRALVLALAASDGFETGRFTVGTPASTESLLALAQDRITYASELDPDNPYFDLIRSALALETHKELRQRTPAAASGRKAQLDSCELATLRAMRKIIAACPVETVWTAVDSGATTLVSTLRLAATPQAASIPDRAMGQLLLAGNNALEAKSWGLLDGQRCSYCDPRKGACRLADAEFSALARRNGVLYPSVAASGWITCAEHYALAAKRSQLRDSLDVRCERALTEALDAIRNLSPEEQLQYKKYLSLTSPFLRGPVQSRLRRRLARP